MPSVAERILARAYAKKIAEVEIEAFAWLLGLELFHDGEPEDARTLIVKALKAYGKPPRRQHQ